MANFILKFGAGFRDARGQVGRVGSFMNLGATGTTAHGVALIVNIVTAWEACTNGALVSLSGFGDLVGNQVLNPDQYGANTEYPNAEDKAVLTFLHADNTLSRMSIPAPIGTGANNIFLPDGETVNPLSTPIVNLIAALTAVGANTETASNKSGSPFNVMVLGMRARRRFQRKLTIWTLNPSDSGPGE